jgi:hypothetical protein
VVVGLWWCGETRASLGGVLAGLGCKRKDGLRETL